MCNAMGVSGTLQTTGQLPTPRRLESKVECCKMSMFYVFAVAIWTLKIFGDIPLKRD